MQEHNVYIDESGDEGIHKGSKYFVLTAILVNKKNDLFVAKSVDSIKEKLEMNIKSQLHWNKVKGYPNKMTIMNTINELDLTVINIIINTQKIKFIPSVNIYNYFSGYLFERIIWFAIQNNSKVNIRITSRGNLKKESLINFLQDRNNKKFKIDYSKINDIKIYPNASKKLLQLADCCCSALGQALKYNDTIHYSYIDCIKQKLYSVKNKVIGYGLKYVPSSKNFSKEFNSLINYLNLNKKRVTPLTKGSHKSMLAGIHSAFPSVTQRTNHS